MSRRDRIVAAVAGVLAVLAAVVFLPINDPAAAADVAAPDTQPTVVVPTSATFTLDLAEVTGTAPAPPPAAVEPVRAPAGPVTGWEDGRCDEDEPCWDCETMGNRICGPIAGAPAPVEAPDPSWPACPGMVAAEDGSCVPASFYDVEIEWFEDGSWRDNVSGLSGCTPGALCDDSAPPPAVETAPEPALVAVLEPELPDAPVVPVVEPETPADPAEDVVVEVSAEVEPASGE